MVYRGEKRREVNRKEEGRLEYRREGRGEKRREVSRKEGGRLE